MLAVAVPQVVQAQVRIGGQTSGRTSWSTGGVGRTVSRSSSPRYYRHRVAIVDIVFQHTSGRTGSVRWKYTIARLNPGTRRWESWMTSAVRTYRSNLQAVAKRGWRPVRRSIRYTMETGTY